MSHLGVPNSTKSHSVNGDGAEWAVVIPFSFLLEMILSLPHKQNIYYAWTSSGRGGVWLNHY